MKRTQKKYRKINRGHLTAKNLGLFNLYYKVQDSGETRFLKFSGKDKKHLDKVRTLFESGEFQEDLYIHEADRMKYYEQATLSLREMIKDPNIPFEEKLTHSYDVSKEVMKEFFEWDASPKLLRVSDQVMGEIDNCLRQEKELGFFLVTNILSKDYFTYTHSINVGVYCMSYGLQIDMPQEDALELGIGGMLHDVGKTKISQIILNKKTKLTDKEFEEVKKHTAYGEEILTEMNCYGERVLQMASQHHEQFDGGGYPNQLKGEDISNFGRICKIVDVYDALTTNRPYNRALSPLDALMVMKKDMDGHFETDLLNDFIRLMGPH